MAWKAVDELSVKYYRDRDRIHLVIGVDGAILNQEKGVRMMLGTPDPRASMGYVTVGLFSHALLRELFSIAEAEGASVPASKNILCAIASLEDIGNPGAEDAGDVLVFQTYESVSVLYQTFDLKLGGLEHPDQVKALLDQILDLQTEPAKKLEATLQAIAFFRALAQQAAINTQYPQDEIPAGVRELAAIIR